MNLIGCVKAGNHLGIAWECNLPERLAFFGTALKILYRFIDDGCELPGQDSRCIGQILLHDGQLIVELAGLFNLFCREAAHQSGLRCQVAQEWRHFFDGLAEQLLNDAGFVAIVSKLAERHCGLAQGFGRVNSFESISLQANGFECCSGTAVRVGAVEDAIELDQGGAHGVELGAGASGDVLQGADVLNAGASGVFEVVQCVHAINGAFGKVGQPGHAQAADDAAGQSSGEAGHARFEVVDVGDGRLEGGGAVVFGDDPDFGI